MHTHQWKKSNRDDQEWWRRVETNKREGEVRQVEQKGEVKTGSELGVAIKWEEKAEKSKSGK